MRLQILFPVLNKVRVLDAHEVKDPPFTFFVVPENGLMKKVGIEVAGIPAEIFAPKLTSGALMTNITLSDVPEKEEMIARIRSWQSLLAPSIVVDIDYQSEEIEYIPEGEEKIILRSLSKTQAPRVEGTENFHEYAMAFYASKLSHDLIEPNAFIIEGARMLLNGFFIQAYNTFYLYLESVFGNGKFKEKDVVPLIAEDRSFSSAFHRTRTLLSNHHRERVPFDPNFFEDHITSCVSKIVKLRGELRHHSSKNSRRWSPTVQEVYAIEARFLYVLCSMHASSLSQGRISVPELVERYEREAREAGRLMSIVLEVTILNGAVSQSSRIVMEMPKVTATPRNCMRLLQICLEAIGAEFHDAPVLGFRLVDEESCTELFRYSLGDAVSRGEN
jgi:hypothetical protein